MLGRYLNIEVGSIPTLVINYPPLDDVAPVLGRGTDIGIDKTAPPNKLNQEILIVDY